MAFGKTRSQITLVRFLNEYLEHLMDELDVNKSELIEHMIYYVSQYQDDFLAQFELVEDVDEDEDQEEDLDEEDEDEEDEG